MYRQTIPLAVLTLAVFACSAFSLDRIVFVTVRDAKGIPVSGLNTEHFRIFENGAPRLIKSVIAEAEPMSIGFVFDASSSATTSLVKKMPIRLRRVSMSS